MLVIDFIKIKYNAYVKQHDKINVDRLNWELYAKATAIKDLNQQLANCTISVTPSDKPCQCDVVQHMEKLERSVTAAAVADQQKSEKLVQRRKYRHHNAAHRRRKAS